MLSFLMLLFKIHFQMDSIRDNINDVIPLRLVNLDVAMDSIFLIILSFPHHNVAPIIIVMIAPNRLITNNLYPSAKRSKTLLY